MTNPKLSVRHLRTDPYSHNEEEVPEGAPYGFWRIVEQTGAGWFPWPHRYATKAAAQAALERTP